MDHQVFLKIQRIKQNLLKLHFSHENMQIVTRFLSNKMFFSKVIHLKTILNLIAHLYVYVKLHLKIKKLQINLLAFYLINYISKFIK